MGELYVCVEGYGPGMIEMPSGVVTRIFTAWEPGDTVVLGGAKDTLRGHPGRAVITQSRPATLPNPPNVISNETVARYWRKEDLGTFNALDAIERIRKSPSRTKQKRGVAVEGGGT